MTTRIKDYSLTPASNNQPAPNGFPEGMPPAGLNDSARQVMADIRAWYEDPAWIDKGYTPVYATATTFTIVGNVTADFIIGDRIRAIGSTPFDIIGEVTNSVFSSPNTTVTVVWDSGSIDTNLTDVLVNVGMRVPFAKMTANDITANSIKAKTADLNLKDASGNNIVTVNATNVISTKPITVNGSSTEAAKIVLAEDTDNGTNTVTVIAPTAITSNRTQTLPDKDGTFAMTDDIQITPWVAYTPSFQGLGTVTGVSFWSRRVGGNLEIRGTATIGTPTAVEARIGFGFNGTNGNVTSNSTILPSGTNSAGGTCLRNAAGAFDIFTLIEPSVTYLTLGAQDGATIALNKLNGSGAFSSSVKISLTASIPITGW